MVDGGSVGPIKPLLPSPLDVFEAIPRLSVFAGPGTPQTYGNALWVVLVNTAASAATLFGGLLFGGALGDRAKPRARMERQAAKDVRRAVPRRARYSAFSRCCPCFCPGWGRANRFRVVCRVCGIFNAVCQYSRGNSQRRSGCARICENARRVAAAGLPHGRDPGNRTGIGGRASRRPLAWHGQFCLPRNFSPLSPESGGS